MKRTFCVLVAAATLASCASGPTAAPSTSVHTERDVLAAHEKRRVATLAADVAALESEVELGSPKTLPFKLAHWPMLHGGGSRLIAGTPTQPSVLGLPPGHVA